MSQLVLFLLGSPRLELDGDPEEAAVVPVPYGRNHLLVKPWVRKFSTSAMSWFLWKDVIIEPHE